MRRIAGIFFAIGVVAILLSVFGGTVQPDNNRELGAAQLLGIEIGIALILIGIGIATSKSDDPTLIWKKLRNAFGDIQRLPTVFWIFFAFFITYLLFFLFPVFLNSNHKMDYVADYIRDQGRIGFDIRSIMERIKDWFVLGQSPYSDGFIAYPPLTIAVFAPLVLLGFPSYFYLMTVLTLLCFIVSSMAISRLIPKQGYGYLLAIFFFTGLFSYGFQFELERGQFNVIAFSLCILAVSLFHWRSDLNYWAYLLFTLSVQLKVYPVFFIVMFIKDWRDWRNNIRRFLGLAALNFSMLFILGSQMFYDFLKAVTAYQFKYDSNRHENLSIKGFVYSLGNGDIPKIPINFATQVQQHSAFLELALFVVLGTSLALIIWQTYSKRETGFNSYLFAWCVLCALIVPSVSNDYKLSILILPTATIADRLLASTNRRNGISLNLLILIYFTAYWSTMYPYTVKPDVLSRNFQALMIMILTLPWLNYLISAKDSHAKPLDQIKSTAP